MMKKITTLQRMALVALFIGVNLGNLSATNLPQLQESPLAISKSVNGNPTVEPSQQVIFTITLQNAGEEAVQGVRIEDNYDQAVFPSINILEVVRIAEVTDATQVGAERVNITQEISIVDNGDIITWELGDVPARTQILLSYQATAAQKFQDTQEVSISLTKVFLRDAEATAFDFSMEIRKPKLTLSRSHAPEADISSGSTVTHTIIYRNEGNLAATGVTIVETFDEKIVREIRNISGNGVREGNTIRWNPGRLEAGQGDNVQYEMILQPIILHPSSEEAGAEQREIKQLVQAAIGADNALSSTAEDEFTINTPILAIERSRSDKNGGAVEPGDTMQFTIQIANTGKDFSKPLTVRETYDKKVIAGIENITNGGVEVEGGVEWVINGIKQGETKDLSYDALLASNVTERLETLNVATLFVDNVEVGQSQTTFTLEPRPAPAVETAPPVLTENDSRYVLFLIGLVATLGFILIGFLTSNLLKTGKWQPRYFRNAIEGTAIIVVVIAVLILSISSNGIDAQGTVSILSAIIGYILGQTTADRGSSEQGSGNKPPDSQ